jgi:hypothetical protein
MDDSLFGPSSGEINVAQFIEDTKRHLGPHSSQPQHTGWDALPDGQRASIEAECEYGFLS